MFKRVLFSIILLLTSCLFSYQISAQQNGGLSGRITDGVTGNALQGANVTIEGTALSTETDRTGAFSLLRVPAGQQKVTVSYLGYETKTFDVEIKADGDLTALNAELQTGIQESVTVNAPLLEGQARALNQQKEAVNITNVVSADQIGRFPDPNSAEAAQRIPGITIERDQGEGRYVQVRGTEARLNSMMINGERIPSPEGDIRAVALDVIPADLLESIEVSKALTADMDADSIGGAVNLITKGAPERTRVSLTAGFGYNRIAENYLQTFNGTFGRRFFNKRLGLLFSGSYLNTDRGSESAEPSYDDGNLDELDLRDYTVNRQRLGVNPFLDYRFSDTSEIYIRGIYNKFNDQEFRRRVVYGVSDGVIERELKDRLEKQTIAQVAFGGRHLLPRFLQIDYRFSYAYAAETEPNRVDTLFEQEDVIFNPNVSPDSIDPDNIQANPLNENINLYQFAELIRADNFTSDRDFTAQFNASLPLMTRNNFAGILKFGVKNRFKKKFRNVEEFEFGFEDDAPLLIDNLDAGFNKTVYYGGRYNIGTAFVDPQRARNFLSNPLIDGERLFEEDAADFRARENVFALYALTQLNFGDRFQLVPGVRFERTDVKYTGFEVLFDEEGDFLASNELPGSNTFNNLFPSVHARYRITDNTNFRAAYTRSLARPNFVDLTPFQLILEEDLEIERGNPFLVPTTSNNFDVMIEHYLSSVGIISGGFFYKRLNNYIFPFAFEEDRPIGGPNGPMDTFRIIEPRNGESAYLYGLELAFQNRFTFLPKPLDGFGVYANYTYVNSKATLPGEDADAPGRRSILPGQAKNIGNFAVFYERFGFSGRASWHYRDLYLSEVAGSPDEDLFIDNHLQFDVSLSQRITKNFRVFAEIINLNNRPFRSYVGVKDRPTQEEYYKWWATFGLKFDW